MLAEKTKETDAILDTDDLYRFMVRLYMHLKFSYCLFYFMKKLFWSCYFGLFCNLRSPVRFILFGVNKCALLLLLLIKTISFFLEFKSFSLSFFDIVGLFYDNCFELLAFMLYSLSNKVTYPWNLIDDISWQKPA